MHCIHSLYLGYMYTVCLHNVSVHFLYRLYLCTTSIHYFDTPYLYTRTEPLYMYTASIQYVSTLYLYVISLHKHALHCITCTLFLPIYTLYLYTIAAYYICGLCLYNISLRHISTAYLLIHLSYNPLCRRHNVFLRQHHLRTLRSVITEDPYKYCLLLRLSPIPLFVKNYGLAALGVPLKPYLYSSCISAIPWTTVEVALGCSANTIVEAWKSDNPSQYALRLTMLCSSVIIMCVVFTLIIRAYRRHMSKHLESITGRDTSTSSSLCNESSLPDSSFSLYDSPNRRSSSSSLRELIPHPHLTSITPPLVFNSTCPSPNAFKLRASTPSTPPTRHSTESQWKGDEDKGDLSENEDSGTSLLPAVVGATSVDGGEEGGREAGTGREEAGLGPE
eukprot:GHVQ01003697.1.p1 GENE.GHVQ01003697.1~~GHVQ01003697.1.p1  ORF type:complete len:391 (+),score=14.04 GHVQ01003697.1:341-1513(+)